MLLFVLFLLLFPNLARAQPPPVTRIAFGSCANQSAPQPIWDAINDFDPQLFIWMGDNIYGDNRRPFRVFGKERTIGPWRNVPRFFPSTEAELRARYALAKGKAGYEKLRRRTKVIGTWDDHDYGLNDAGKEFSGKNITQKLMLDFLDESPNSPRHKQAGVYASYLFGPKGKDIKIILLDTRYNRDPQFSDGTILGETQWTWLAQELRSPPSQMTIIGSSIQVISNISALTGPLFYLESWSRFPRERTRLFQLIASSKRTGVIFISGDVHFGEITRYDCACGYPLYDITSSGLTQAVEEAVPAVVAFFVRFIAWITPSTLRVYGPKCRRRSCTYGRPNFGAIEIDWNATPISVKIEVRNIKGDAVAGTNLFLHDLQTRDVNSTKNEMQQQQYCTLETNLPWATRHRLAIIFYMLICVAILTLLTIVYEVVLISKKCFRKCKFE